MHFSKIYECSQHEGQLANVHMGNAEVVTKEGLAVFMKASTRTSLTHLCLNRVMHAYAFQNS